MWASQLRKNGPVFTGKAPRQARVVIHDDAGGHLGDIRFLGGTGKVSARVCCFAKHFLQRWIVSDPVDCAIKL
jgi:hypothetical protein